MSGKMLLNKCVLVLTASFLACLIASLCLENKKFSTFSFISSVFFGTIFFVSNENEEERLQRMINEAELRENLNRYDK
jgi:hypothetical protein